MGHTNKRFDAKLLGLSLLSVLAFCFALFKMEYATDTYTVITVGMKLFGDSMFQNGRLVTASAFYLFDAMWPDITAFYYVSFLLSLLFSALAIFEMTKLYGKRFDLKISFPLAFLTVLNPLSVEYFLFIEKGYFMLAILMSVLALKFFVGFLNGEKRCLIAAYVCLAVSAFTYQTMPGLFAVLAVPFALLYAKNGRQLCKNIAIAVSVYGFGTLLNFLFIKFIGGTSRAGSKIYVSNLLKSFLFGGSFANLLIYVAAALLLLFVCAFYVFRIEKRFNRRRTFLLFGKCALTVFAALFVTFFPFLFVNPSEVWFPCRILYPIGTLIGTMPLLFLCEKREDTQPVQENAGENRASRILSVALCALLAVNLVFFNTVTFSRLRNNHVDHALCERIGEYIEQYEAETGNEITAVSIYHDAKLSKHNPAVLVLGDSNVRAFSKDWSDVAHMNVLLGRSFEKVECDGQIYAIYFANRDWSEFHEDQLVFEGNTLHLCVY